MRVASTPGELGGAITVENKAENARTGFENFSKSNLLGIKNH